MFGLEKPRLNEPLNRPTFLSGFGGAQTRARTVGIVDDAIGPAGRQASLSALFPHVAFENLGPVWPDRIDADVNILMTPVSASSAAEVDAAITRLQRAPPHLLVVVILRDADVATTRLLAREGAADVIPAPVSEPALALCLERLLTRGASEFEAGGSRRTGEVIGFLKAGGGVGATALAVQAAALMARGVGNVCLADLDLQFGAAANYLDLPDAVTLSELLGVGESLEQTPFVEALPEHRSGLRLLAAPRELTPLEVLSTAHIDALLKGLRRDFDYTLVDLPSVWTQWTSRVVEMADRMVVVTHLTVPNIQLVKRQLRMLDDKPAILVCNTLSQDHQSTLSIKAAERALERAFDVIIPEDRRVMLAAVNQGLEVSAVRRGTKLEKGISELAEKIAARATAKAPVRGRR
jgi:pilus assembly protein CpaE